MDTDTVRDYVSRNRLGIVYDLVFAVVWVTAVTVIHSALQGPEWAYYLLLLAGVPAYFVFQASLSAAKADSSDTGG